MPLHLLCPLPRTPAHTVSLLTEDAGSDITSSKRLKCLLPKTPPPPSVHTQSPESSPQASDGMVTALSPSGLQAPQKPTFYPKSRARPELTTARFIKQIDEAHLKRALFHTQRPPWAFRQPQFLPKTHKFKHTLGPR